ncbi:MAG: hypothetical protein ACI8PY_000833, partial [Oceanospirillaceae bacterium]
TRERHYIHRTAKHKRFKAIMHKKRRQGAFLQHHYRCMFT